MGSFAPCNCGNWLGNGWGGHLLLVVAEIGRAVVMGGHLLPSVAEIGWGMA